MPELSLKKIKTLLETYQPLPKAYSIKPESLEIKEVFSTLALFKDPKDMVICIEKLSSPTSMGIKCQGKTYSMGSLADFLYVYALNDFETENLSTNSIRALNALFNRVAFSKARLLILIEQLSYVNLYDHILLAQCFSKNELLEIVNDQNILCRFKPEMLSCLYFYFNPQREWKTSHTPLLDMYYFAKRAGHGLGLSDEVEFEFNKRKYKFKTEGQLESNSLKHLTKHIEIYNQKYPSQTTAAILAAFQFSENLIRPIGNPYQPEAAEKFLVHFLQDELTYFTVQWWYHGFGVALYGDYFIYANRGEAGDPRHGCKIFKIKDKKLITKEFIDKLTNASLDKPRAFFSLIEPIININDPVIKFSSKKQKHGTCTFVNPKAIMEGMIVLLNTGPHCTPQEMKKWFFGHYRKKNYKHITSFIRDTEVDELIKNMFYAKNEVLQHFYAALVKKIIRAHHGQQNRGWFKDKEEVRRSLDLYNRLPSSIKTIVDSDVTFSELIASIQAMHSKLFPSKFEESTSEYIKPIFFRGHHHKVKLNGKGNIINVDGKATPEMHFSYRLAKTMIVAQR